MSSLSRADTLELQPTTFVRGSAFRKSFRIRNRNSKLPPSALIFMKSLECKVSQFDSLSASENFSTEKIKEKTNRKTSNGYELLTEDEQCSCAKSTQKHRSSFRKSSGKKKNSLINFFRK